MHYFTMIAFYLLLLEIAPLLSAGDGNTSALSPVDPRAVRARQDLDVCANVLVHMLDLPKSLIACAIELRLARHGCIFY